MAYNIDFTLATSSQIEKAIGARLEAIRLSRNMTQQQVATQAGVSLRTIRRLEKGKGVSFGTLIRVMTALDIQQSLASLLPNPKIRPIELVDTQGAERKRARPKESEASRGVWVWGDEGEKDER